MTSVNIGGYILPDSQKLDGKNYVIWKLKISNILALQRLMEYVEEKGKRPKQNPVDEIEEAAWFDRNQKALAIINLLVADEVITHLQGKTLASQAWKTLKDLFETKNETRVSYLRNQLYSCKMTNNDSITSRLQKLKETKEQLIAVGEDIQGRELVSITLNSLHAGFHIFVTSICLTSRPKPLTFDELSGLLLQEEQRMGFYNEGECSSIVLASKFKKKPINHVPKHPPQASNNTQKSKRDVTCKYCNKKGHLEVQCWKKKANIKKSTTALSTKENDKVFVFNATNQNSCEWYVDSGA